MPRLSEGKENATVAPPNIASQSEAAKCAAEARWAFEDPDEEEPRGRGAPSPSRPAVTVHTVAGGCLGVMMQRLCAKRCALIGPYFQTPYLHQNCDLPSPASVAVHSSGESPGSTRSAVWHNLLADWESLPSTRGAPVRLPSPSTD